MTAQIKNPTDFANALLGALGAPDTKTNVQNVLSWYGREGGNWDNTAKFNPLNTTQTEPGSVNFDTGQQGSGVQAYGNWQQGIDATVQTLNTGSQSYQGILDALNTSQPYSVFATAVQNSQWDAGHYNHTLVSSGPAPLGSNTTSSGSTYNLGVTATQQDGAVANSPGKGNKKLTGFAGILQQLDQYYNPNTPTGFSSLVHLPTTLSDTATMIFVRGISAMLATALVVMGVKSLTSGSSAGSSGGGRGGTVLDFVNNATRDNQRQALSGLRLQASKEKEEHVRARQSANEQRRRERDALTDARNKQLSEHRHNSMIKKDLEERNRNSRAKSRTEQAAKSRAERLDRSKRHGQVMNRFADLKERDIARKENK